MTAGPVLTVMEIEPMGLYRLRASIRYKSVGSIVGAIGDELLGRQNMTAGPVLTVTCMSAVQK